MMLLRFGFSSLKSVVGVVAAAALTFPFARLDASEESEALSELKKIEAQFSGAHDLLLQPLHDLNKNYAEALGKLLDSEAAAGRLESSVEVKTEIEAFGDGSTYSKLRFGKRETENQALERLRNVYREERTSIERQLERPESELIGKMDERLQQFEAEQTKAQNFDVALATKKVRQDLRTYGLTAELFKADLHFAAKGELEMRVDGADVEIENKSTESNYTYGTIPALTLEGGSVIVFRIRSQAVFRGVVMALTNEEGTEGIPVPRSAYRICPEKMFESAPETRVVERLNTTPEPASVDPKMGPMWESLGVPEDARQASEWVQPPLKDEWNYFAIVVDGDMILRDM